MNIKFSKLVFRFLPAILCICYGISMGLLFYQWSVVGPFASIVRLICWQAVLALALADRSHLEAKDRVEELEGSISAALDTVGIRRTEFAELKQDVTRLKDYLAKVEFLLRKD